LVDRGLKCVAVVEAETVIVVQNPIEAVVEADMKGMNGATLRIVPEVEAENENPIIEPDLENETPTERDHPTPTITRTRIRSKSQHRKRNIFCHQQLKNFK
jgi:hypothetical protein